MLNWQIEQVKLELKYTWKISRNASEFKINSIITVSNSMWKGMGEVAPNIRYNETPENILDGFHRFVAAGACDINDLHELQELLTELRLPNALRFGIESAYIHYLCHADKTDLFTFLGLERPRALETSFSLPIMEIGEIENFYQHNNLERFARLKVKVDSESALDLIAEINRITRQPLIIDGNEAWKNPETTLAFLHALTPYNITLIEQPMPAGLFDEYVYLKTNSPYLLFADESICDDADFNLLKTQFHGINIKLMKTGGYINAIRLLNEARTNNMHTMIGCMIETSLGISSAMHLCAGVNYIDLDGFLILKQDPIGIAFERNGMMFSSVDY